MKRYEDIKLEMVTNGGKDVTRYDNHEKYQVMKLEMVTL